MLAVTAAMAFLSGGSIDAREWYVAPGGADGSAGTTSDPLATVAHAISRASAGDAILLERGGTYFASDVNAGSNLSVAAYGKGPRPIVTGGLRVNISGTWGSNPSRSELPR